MLQDKDPLWEAIQELLRNLDEANDQHGGLIGRGTLLAASRLRQQLAIDRAKEAKAAAQRQTIHLAPAL